MYIYTSYFPKMRVQPRWRSSRCAGEDFQFFLSWTTFHAKRRKCKTENKLGFHSGVFTETEINSNKCPFGRPTCCGWMNVGQERSWTNRFKIKAQQSDRSLLSTAVGLSAVCVVTANIVAPAVAQNAAFLWSILGLCVCKCWWSQLDSGEKADRCVTAT